MQLPGLDELEAVVGRTVEQTRALKAENADLARRLRALGKELDDLTAQLEALLSDQKVDSRKRKRIEKRLESLSEKLD